MAKGKPFECELTISDVPPMDDEQLGRFWEVNEPEEVEGWEEGTLEFKRVPKKLIQLRLEPKDIRIINFIKPPAPLVRP